MPNLPEYFHPRISSHSLFNCLVFRHRIVVLPRNRPKQDVLSIRSGYLLTVLLSGVKVSRAKIHAIPKAVIEEFKSTRNFANTALTWFALSLLLRSRNPITKKHAINPDCNHPGDKSIFHQFLVKTLSLPLNLLCGVFPVNAGSLLLKQSDDFDLNQY
jgi:hypothetical protein